MNFAVRLYPFALCIVLLGCTGCKVEQGPTRDQVHQTELARNGDATHSLPVSHIDDSQLVIKACGQPDADRLYGLYDKAHWGTVRRLTYTSMAGDAVQLDFVPSLPGPAANHTVTPDSEINPANMPPPQLPIHAVWRFDDAHVGHQDILTSSRLQRSMPCAAAALQHEY